MSTDNNQTKDSAETGADTAAQTAALLAEVRKLNEHRFVRAHDSWWGLFYYQILRGLAFGFGSVLGATVLVSLLVFLLGEMDFIPILGDWAIQILDIINQR